MPIVFFEHEKCLLNPIFMKQKLLEGDGALDKDYRFTFKSNQLKRFIYQKYYRFYVPMPLKQATCFPLKPLKKFSLPTNYRKGCTVILSILLFVFRIGFHSKCRYTFLGQTMGLDMNQRFCANNAKSFVVKLWKFKRNTNIGPFSN